MFRAPLRRLRPASLPAARAAVPRRAASTASGAKKGTWKGTAARWGVAGAAVYWYCTSPIFADDPAPQVKVPLAEDEELTVEKVIEQKRKEIEARAREREAKEAQQAEAQKQLQEQEQEKPEAEQGEGEAVAVPAEAGSPQALEEEAGQQGAFNPETGEINWDCPCLGGMAHGPCGEEFRAAFSCFVYSEEEPKGMDCIDKFQGMQDCFRRHPDVYGAELAEEEEAEAEARAAAAAEQEGKTTEEPAAPKEGKTTEEPAAPKEAAPAAEKEATSAQEKEVAPAAPAPEKDALAANEGKAAPAEETAAKEEKKTDA